MPTSNTDTDTHIYIEKLTASQNSHWGMPGNIFISAKPVLRPSLDYRHSGSHPFLPQFFLSWKQK